MKTKFFLDSEQFYFDLLITCFNLSFLCMFLKTDHLSLLIWSIIVFTLEMYKNFNNINENWSKKFSIFSLLTLINLLLHGGHQKWSFFQNNDWLIFFKGRKEFTLSNFIRRNIRWHLNQRFMLRKTRPVGFALKTLQNYFPLVNVADR